MRFCFLWPPFSSLILREPRRLTGIQNGLLFFCHVFCDSLVVSFHRCFVDGCDDNLSPQYIADWMDENLITDLEFDSKHWQCEFPKLVILPECAVNITVNDTCSRWIFDPSIFSSTIVTEVIYLSRLFSAIKLFNHFISVQFLLVCDNSWKTTFVSSLTMAGFMVGAFSLGPLPDVFVFQFYLFHIHIILLNDR